MAVRAAAFVLVAGVLSAAAPARAQGDPRDADFQKEVTPFLKQFCIKCHSGTKPKGGLDLSRLHDAANLVKGRKTWVEVTARLRAREMPPAKNPLPTGAEIDRISTLVDNQLRRTQPKDPGRVTLRRLNRAEYNNTIRDLVGVRFQPADDFPADDVGYGFDNIGDVLSLSPLLLEKYLAATEKITAAAFAVPELRRQIFIRQPKPHDHEECARVILENFAHRAYRRPVLAGELDRLVRLVRQAEQHGDKFDQGIQLALNAILVSPHFLFRVELDPPHPQGGPHPINDYELASRLSYFLWSSMPDNDLFGLAQQGTLHQRDLLENQVRRMLKHPKSQALVTNFAGQWLQLRSLSGMTPDPGQFPRFDEGLRSAMRRETESFFEAIVRDDRSILDFLDSDYTFLNERLARHYGIEGVQGEAFQRVSLAGSQRGGLVTQASILTVTSNPTRTSPVKRGKWILENILGTPPPPPPPGVQQLSEAKDVVLSGSLRQRMELHRSDSGCASCHQRMDPLGFGLENFDAVGAWRDRDGSFPVDASGTLPDGRTFDGPRGLRAILKARARDFRCCLAEKMLTYALGRGLESYDRPAIDRIREALEGGQDRFSTLVLAVVASDQFLMRNGKKDTDGKRERDAAKK
jgi:hypothetical protein